MDYSFSSFDSSLDASPLSLTVLIPQSLSCYCMHFVAACIHVCVSRSLFRSDSLPVFGTVSQRCQQWTLLPRTAWGHRPFKRGCTHSCTRKRREVQSATLTSWVCWLCSTCWLFFYRASNTLGEESLHQSGPHLNWWAYKDSDEFVLLILSAGCDPRLTRSPAACQHFRKIAPAPKWSESKCSTNFFVPFELNAAHTLECSLFQMQYLFVYLPF